MKKYLIILLFLISAPANSQIVQGLQIPAVLNTANVPSTTVAGLPTCNAGLTGKIYLVTDALLPTVLGALTGGGAVTTLVHCNGTIFVAG